MLPYNFAMYKVWQPLVNLTKHCSEKVWSCKTNEETQSHVLCQGLVRVVFPPWTSTLVAGGNDIINSKTFALLLTWV